MEDNYITGYVFFFQAGEEPAVMIGNTIESLEKRRLYLQAGNHKKLRIIGAIDLKKVSRSEGLGRLEYSALAREREAEIHKLFAKSKIHGKWFSLTPELQEFIRQASNV
jgi:hypothetical protein